MTDLGKYRPVALVVALVFGVFNIGIPVVIASCSMSDMMQGSHCPMCDEREIPTAATFTTEQSQVCCTSTIVAERNTTEFTHAKAQVLESAMQCLSLVRSSAVFSSRSSVSTLAQVSPSPPIVVDIPITTSSLLI